MIQNTTDKPITQIRREILESLASGAMLVINKTNSAWLGDRDVSQTRYWLVDNKLVERKDKTKKVDVLGNGLVITSKGLDLLAAQPIPKSRNVQITKNLIPIAGESKPSDRQIEYARSLGISVSPAMTFEEVSDLINCVVEKDYLAQEIFKKIATENSIFYTQYTGSKDIRGRIFRSFSRPAKEQLFVRWFAIFVLFDRKAIGLQDDDIWSKQELVEISKKLECNEAVVKSIHRYADADLMLFGKQISSDGVETSGSSRDTVAYRSIVELL